MTLNSSLCLSCIWVQRWRLLFVFIKTVRLRRESLDHFGRPRMHRLLALVIAKNDMLSCSLLLLQLNRCLQHPIGIIFLHTPNSFCNGKNRLWQVFLEFANRSDGLLAFRSPISHLTTFTLQALLAHTKHRLKLLFSRDLDSRRTRNLGTLFDCNGFIHVLLMHTDGMWGHLWGALAIL